MERLGSCFKQCITLKPEQKKYYSRHILLENFGEDAQLKLAKANVLIIGAGGLGCPVSLYLAGAGVGTISVLDYDVVDESNLPRQILYEYADIGKPKASCAAAYLKKRNPFVIVNGICEKLSASNVLDLVSSFDLVVDGSDNFATRYLINDACVILNKPFVSGAVVGYEGQVSVFNFNNGPTYRCLYPQPPLPGEMPSCSQSGVLNALTGWVGSLMAQETIKVITGIGEPLKGRLAVLDGLSCVMNEFRFFRGTYFPKTIEETYAECADKKYDVISMDTFKKLQAKYPTTTLIDVREEWEIDEPLAAALHMPLADIPQRYKELNQGVIAFTCSKGERSRLAAQWAVDNMAEADVYVIDNQ
ncbi:MAG: ThiF family adenylyltransferase [Flavobacteriales bacterium]